MKNSRNSIIDDDGDEDIKRWKMRNLIYSIVYSIVQYIQYIVYSIVQYIYIDDHKKQKKSKVDLLVNVNNINRRMQIIKN